MPLPLWAIYGGMTAAGGIANMLKGKSKQEKMLEWLKGEANKPESELGYTPAEMNAKRFGTKSRLSNMAAERYSANKASAARRGGTFGSQAGMDIEGDYAKAYGDYLPALDAESAAVGRNRKDRLTDMLFQGTMNLPDESITGDIGDISQNLMQLILMGRNKKKGQPGGFNSAGFMPGLG